LGIFDSTLRNTEDPLFIATPSKAQSQTANANNNQIIFFMIERIIKTVSKS